MSKDDITITLSREEAEECLQEGVLGSVYNKVRDAMATDDLGTPWLARSLQDEPGRWFVACHGPVDNHLVLDANETQAKLIAAALELADACMLVRNWVIQSANERLPVERIRVVEDALKKAGRL